MKSIVLFSLSSVVAMAQLIGPPTPAVALRDVAPKAPLVSYVNNQLTIDAENSTLGDVLVAVGKAAKIDIDLPPGAGGERVIAKVGPGRPADVLSEFLAGTKFDFVLAQSDIDETRVRALMLISPSPRGPAEAAGAGPRGVMARAVPTPEPEAPAREEVAPKASDNPPVVSAAPPAAAPPASTSSQAAKQEAQNSEFGSLLQLYRERKQMIEQQQPGKPE